MGRASTMPRLSRLALQVRLKYLSLCGPLESARLIRGYVAGVSFEEFGRNSEKRDAVAWRLSVLGESAHKIDKVTETIPSRVPFKNIRGMRNRIAHDYGAVDFQIVWAVARVEIEPVIGAPVVYFKK